MEFESWILYVFLSYNQWVSDGFYVEGEKKVGGKEDSTFLIWATRQIELLLIAVTLSSVSTIIGILAVDMLSYLVTQYFGTI